jgi:uracil-DNA glycosylase
MTAARDLLRCYLLQLMDAGFDELRLENLTREQALELAAGRPAPGNVAPAAPGSTGSGILAQLGEKAAGCTACRLHESRRSVVFGEGPGDAEIVVIGEAPGEVEDRTGRPFVGPAGGLLDVLLMTAGFARERVYICNVLKCRPPGNRDPLDDEVDQCTTTFLHPQIDAITPRVMLAVGKFAAQSLLGSDAPISRMRNTVHQYRGTPLVVSYHPAFLLRSPHMCRVAWHDFQLLRRVYNEQQG